MLTTHSRFSEAIVPAFNRTLSTPQKPVDSTPTATPALRVDSFEKSKATTPPPATSVRSGTNFSFFVKDINWAGLMNNIPRSRMEKEVAEKLWLCHDSVPFRETGLANPDQAQALKTGVEQVIEYSVLTPLRNGKLLPENMGKPFLAIQDVSVGVGENASVKCSYQLVETLPTPNDSPFSLMLEPEYFKLLGLNKADLEEVVQAFGQLSRPLQPKITRKALFNEIKRVLSQGSNDAKIAPLEMFIKMMMSTHPSETTCPKFTIGASKTLPDAYMNPQQLSNILELLGRYEKTVANRKLVQQKLDDSLIECLSDLLLPKSTTNENEIPSLTITEHTPIENNQASNVHPRGLYQKYNLLHGDLWNYYNWCKKNAEV